MKVRTAGQLVVLSVLTVILVAGCERIVGSTETEKATDCPCWDANLGAWIWVPCDEVTDACQPPETDREEE